MNSLHPTPARAANERAALPRWCIDDDTHDNVIARRNVLAALWAGGLMGLSGARLTAYATEVHLADFQLSGDADIVAKLVADLHRAGLAARPSEVRARLGAFHGQALRQTSRTD